MIASLNIMAKTFAKIVKMFAGLLVTIIAKRRRPVLILHLEAKSAKMNCENEIYTKNWVRSTWTAKSQPGKSQRSKAITSAWWRNHWLSAEVSKLTYADTSSDDVTRADVAELMMLVDRVLARVGAWKRMKRICGTWWRVILTSRILAVCVGAWKV